MEMSSFFAATVHCFKNFSSQCMLLSFVSFKGSHAGAKISEELESIVAKNGIARKVDYVVTDNAASMKKAFTVSSCFQFDDDHHGDSSYVVDTREQLDDDTVWENLDAEDEEKVNTTTDRISHARVSCFAHILPLVKDEMNKVSGSKSQNMKALMGKCTKIASLCHQSNSFKEKFEEKIGKGRSIPAANATRWSSTHAQMDAISEIDSDKLAEVLRLTDQTHLILTVRELAMLNELVSVLDQFAEATTLSQGEKYTIVGCVTPCVVGLYKNLMAFQQICKYQGTVVQGLMDSLCL